MAQRPEWHSVVHAAERLVVVTGAGISVASGIPSFRGDDPGAVWSESVTEVATRGFFLREPVRYWAWNRQLYAPIKAARPNPAHMALARLARLREAAGRQTVLVTQNIDTLHEDAGSPDVIKIHGTVTRVRCVKHGCMHGAPRGSLAMAPATLYAIEEATDRVHLPRCPACEALLRPHVLWFDETYTGHHDYRYPDARRAADEADVVLFVGTSYAVGITDMFVGAGCARGIPMISVDPHKQPPDRVISWVAERAEVALPALVATSPPPV